MSSAPATQRIGTPTQRRQSSARQSMPMMPTAMWNGVIFDALVTVMTSAR